MFDRAKRPSRALCTNRTATIADLATMFDHYPPDTTAVFWLENRRRQDWRDKVEIEATHRHDPNGYSDEELARIVAGSRFGATAPLSSALSPCRQ